MPWTTPTLLRAFAVVLWAAAATCSVDALAWEPRIHRAIAAAAEDRLSEVAREQLAVISETPLAEQATVMDSRRAEPGWAWTRRLHYAQVDPAARRFEPEVDCADGYCVTAAIEHFAHRLADADLPREERELALQIVAHAVADVHQPLNVSYAHDRGGDEANVWYDGRLTDLHSLWGGPIADLALEDLGPPIVATGQPLDWANESLAATRQYVYGLPRGGAVPDWYIERGRAVAAQRMTLATARLTALLEACLTGQDPGFDDPAPDYDRRAGLKAQGRWWALGGAALLLLFAAGVWALRQRRSLGALGRMSAWAGRHPGLVAGAGVATVLTISADLTLPMLYRHAFDVTIPTRDLGGLLTLTLVGVAAVGVTVLGYWLSAISLSRLTAAVQHALRIAMARRLETASLGALGRMPQAEILSRFQSDLPQIDGLITIALPRLLRGLLVGTGCLALMVWIDWRLTLTTLAFLPLGLLGPRLLGPRASRASRSHLEAEASAAGVMLDILRGTALIRAFQLQPLWRSIYGDRARLVADLSRRFSWLAVMTQGTTAIGMMVLTVTVIVVGTWMAIERGVSVGSLAGAFVLLAHMGSAVARMSSAVPALARSVTAYRRIEELLAIEEVEGDTPSGVSAARPLKQAIRFKEVVFSYDGETRHLDRLSVTIPAGRSTAIVGPSGSGKSTLFHLLLRHGRPTEGTILWDGPALSELPPSATLGATGLVPQQPMLFSTTIGDNIRMGRLDATEEQVRDAARKAQIDEVIEALPRGYDTPVGDGGAGLSGGQLQRIAIARALVRDPSVLLLDEATSSLDPATAAEVGDMLQTTMSGRTVVSITHNLESVPRFDHIVVLEAGRLVDSGSHDTLMQRCELYRGLHEQQRGIEVSGDGRSGHIGPDRLRTIDLLEDAPDDLLERLSGRLAVESFRDGEEVVRHGETGERMFLIGRGRLTVKDAEGRSLGVVETGGTVGELALLGDGRRTATLVARGFTTLFSLSRRAFEEASAEWPEFARSVAELGEARRRANAR